MNNNTKTMLLILIAYTILGITGCKQSTEPKLEVEMRLELEDVSCTEAWIKLTTNNLQLPATINLIKNNTVAQSFSLSSKDSLLYIDSLLPNQTYKLQVSHIVAGSIQNPVSSNELTVTTMDTTSHEFTWQSWEFGECSSSSLYDVAIIDENNIWAVGEIYMRDSLGNCDPNAYNAVHWDGTKWELKRITVNFRGSFITPPLEGLFAFSSTDIWFVGSLPIHGDGSNWQIYDLRTLVNPNLTVSKAWGTNSNNMYFVGRNGNIAHWDGVRWRKIESGTDLAFLDVYGEKNSRTGEIEILAVCTRNYPLNKDIYKISPSAAIKISSEPIQWELFSCWFIPERHYYVVGGGIYEKKYLSDSNWRNGPLDITQYGTSCIRGTNLNNVFVVGAYGEVLHFNGFSWKSFLPELGTLQGSYGSVDIKNNIVAITGYDGRKAKITIARAQK